MGLIEVTAISKSKSLDYTEFMSGLVRFGELDVTSVNDLVKKVAGRAISEGSSIGRLDIYAHGTSTYMSVGSDSLHAFTPGVHMAKLKKLKGVLAPSAVVTLWVCEVGKAEELITMMSAALGAIVQANKGDVYPNMLWGSDKWFAAWPNGTYARTMSGGPPY